MAIEFDNVSYIYNAQTAKAKPILENLSFKLKDNTITGFIGPSGSGKTTIAQLIDGLMLPTEGRVTVGQVQLSGQHYPNNLNELRLTVGFVFQNPETQFFCKTVQKEIEFALKNFSFKLSEKDKRISDSLKMIGLNDTYLKRNPFELSQGEQRKVAIATVLAYNPKVIILDEPTRDLDAPSRHHLIKLIKMMKLRYHKTIIIMTTDTDMLHALADDIYIINNGKIVQSGDKYTIFKDTATLNKYQLKIPKIIEFSNLVKDKKGLNIGYRDDVNDLIKDIYRHVK